MASQAESPVSESSRNPSNIEFSLFPPFLLGFTNANPFQDSELGDRFILINPVTRSMFVIESSSLESLLTSLFNKDGQPPASKASIDALRSVEISEEEEEEEEKEECAICLEEWGVGGTAKEMPCQHRFHKECIEKWLGIHGSCPVCRYKMPVEDDDEVKQKIESRLMGFTLSDIQQFLSNQTEA